MNTEVSLREFEEMQEVPSRPPVEFEGQNGLVLKQLVDWDAQELLQFIEANREANEEFASQLNQIQTEYDALQMIKNPHFATFGGRQGTAGPIAALVTVEQETEDRVSIGFVVDGKFKRQGIATNAVTTISQNLLRTRQFNTVRCYVLHENKINRMLLEKCGFSLAGERPNVHLFYDLDEPLSETQISNT